MNDQIIEKRNLLRTLSNAAIQAAEDLNLDPNQFKVNDLLMMFVYNPNTLHTFNTFMGWKYEGYTVKKGVKAYLLWGQPINKTRTDKTTGETIQGNDDDQEPAYFPLAYLFREDQVSKIEARTKQTKQLPTKQPTPEPFDINV
jgi:hypothetical protein